jgi:hypothetical protein
LAWRATFVRASQEHSFDGCRITKKLIAGTERWDAPGLGFCPEPSHGHFQLSGDDVQAKQFSLHAASVVAEFSPIHVIKA